MDGGGLIAFKEVGHILMARKSRRGDAALIGFGRNHARMVRCDRGGSIRQTATSFGGESKQVPRHVALLPPERKGQTSKQHSRFNMTQRPTSLSPRHFQKQTFNTPIHYVPGQPYRIRLLPKHQIGEQYLREERRGVDGAGRSVSIGI